MGLDDAHSQLDFLCLTSIFLVTVEQGICRMFPSCFYLGCTWIVFFLSSTRLHELWCVAGILPPDHFDVPAAC